MVTAYKQQSYDFYHKCEVFYYTPFFCLFLKLTLVLIEDLPLICAQRRAFCVPKTRYWSVVSVIHDVGLSCIQWRASNHQSRPSVGVVWSSDSSMQELQGEGRGLRYSWTSVLWHAGTSHSRAKSQNGSCGTI